MVRVTGPEKTTAPAFVTVTGWSASSIESSSHRETAKSRLVVREMVEPVLSAVI